MTYSLTLREEKGSKLSITEMDNNFLFLEDSFTIDLDQLAFGSGVGLTSSPNFVIANNSLVVSNLILATWSTTDPGVLGQLWLNGGYISISSGVGMSGGTGP